MTDKDEKPQLSLDLKAESDSSEAVRTEEKIDEGRTLEWVCHPARRNRTVTILVSVLIAALVVIVYFLTYSVWFCVLAFLILFGSLSSFYFPTHYRLTENEIIVKTRMQTLHKKWSQYRTFYPDKNGVLLSPFTRPTRLENFRGIYMKFWYNKDEVVAFVKEQIEKQKSESGGK
jgi:hypothetical protein